MKRKRLIASVVLVLMIATAIFVAFAPAASASTYLYSKSVTASVILASGEGGGSGIFKAYYDVYDDKVVFTSCYLQNCVNNRDFYAYLKGGIYGYGGQVVVYVTPTRLTQGNWAKYWFTPMKSTTATYGYVRIYWVGSAFYGQKSWSR